MAFALVPLSFSLLFLLPSFALAQNGGNLTVGASLTASDQNSSWLSPSGDFAFGFRQLNNSVDLFLLAIWYDNIPEKTIVWYANGDDPAPKNSKVELTDGGLVLTNPRGAELWRSVTTGAVTSGAMTDAGNFVLQDGPSVAWESFKNPTDTILPSQTLDRQGVLSSRYSDANFSRGRFQLKLQEDGNLVLATVNLPSTHTNEPYYESGTEGDSNSSSPGYQLIFNSSGYLYILRENRQKFTLSVEPPTGNFYHRATLNFDGVFTHYYRPKTSTGNERWTPILTEPSNICQNSRVTAGSGVCGFNSVCTLVQDQRPTCECPSGYSLFDPNDQYGGCKANFTQRCEESEMGPVEDLYGFEVLLNTDWPTSDYALLQPFTEDGCRQSCLQDCMCAVAIFRSGNMCWKKKLPLSNGRVDPNLDGKALIKVRRGDVPRIRPEILEKEKKNRDDRVVVGAVLLGCSMFANLLLVSAICLGCFLIRQKKLKRIPQQDSFVETNLRCFGFKELEEATDGFKEELGRGAFGIVYKGVINVGCSIPVAVKRLDTLTRDAMKEFRTELNVIGQTHHKNLVRLLGFCDDGEHRLLVYEFLSNGTLSTFLFGDKKPGWNKRIQIAFGIARGLLYLHEECNTQVIHCDIKPQNILLDDCYNARICDFGLAKLLSLDQSYTLTAIRGTKGYVAPDWFRNLPITVKVDVYSFGVLLLEIICCRRSVEMDIEGTNTENAILTDWAYDCYCEGSLDTLVGQDTDALDDRENLQRFVMVAIWCVQEDPSLRPVMKQVIQMLEGVVEIPIPPCPCPFSVTT
ncbi:G-type lectin S-receptor-like serine/threonine-protein kinase LECRK3 [Hevea brasiliensis]|uniref:G-type lectin S-receptor-like serine/threonine-protein kinase LECRK3 n=1 Tax=Hevea brasiliensis TaxID=3981 RepID=UPI0025E30A35|nr:G-type lectin S-receptor-like serine/threonine-protein kinase LECRK3 [Hevea brasiliensis]